MAFLKPVVEYSYSVHNNNNGTRKIYFRGCVSIVLPNPITGNQELRTYNLDVAPHLNWSFYELRCEENRFPDRKGDVKEIENNLKVNMEEILSSKDQGIIKTGYNVFTMSSKVFSESNSRLRERLVRKFCLMMVRKKHNRGRVKYLLSKIFEYTYEEHTIHNSKIMKSLYRKLYENLGPNGYDEEQSLSDSLICLGALLADTIPCDSSFKIWPTNRAEIKLEAEMFMLYGLEAGICSVLQMGHILVDNI